MRTVRGCSISHKTFLILQIEECKINYTQNLYIYVYKLCGFKRNALSSAVRMSVCARTRTHIHHRLSTVCAVYFVIEFESLTLQYKLCLGSYVRLFTCLACIFCPNGFSSQSQRKWNEYGRMTSTDLRIYNTWIPEVEQEGRREREREFLIRVRMFWLIKSKFCPIFPIYNGADTRTTVFNVHPYNINQMRAMAYASAHISARIRNSNISN